MARLVLVHPKRATVAPSEMPQAPDAVGASALLLASQGDHEGQVAEAALALWCRVEAELSSVIGAKGVAALYRRSLHRARAQHPALAEVHEAATQVEGFEPLRRALASLSHADAASASRALVQAFYQQLVGLIGAALTERLLKPAARAPSNGPTLKDTPP
jgi:hypothetical protein